ncbi:MAG: PAS domain-containing sensor histidine kinase [Alphaproteobacteria bacterium]|nr:MAG: PAS domain-containing sensor histidine kinase [Alphaproteobacteria bacterium]
MNDRKEDAALHSALLESILNNIVDGLITIDEMGIVQSYNKACAKIFGYDAGEVLGRNVKMLMPQAYAVDHDQYIANYRNTGKARIIGIGREVEGRRKDGSIFPLDLSVAEVKVGDRRFFSGILRDITARKSAEMSLMRSNQELEQFAYVASHDLKTPLRNIDNLAQWVVEDNEKTLNADARDKLALLRNCVTRLEVLLDDILAYSRAGRIVDDAREVDVGDLVRQVAQTHVPASFEVRLPPKLPKIVSPPTPLTQIFGNIFSNAVKHHDKGRGVIEVRCEPIGRFYEFSVLDDGPGIPPQYHERAFQMFQTLQSRDKVEGSGMGMAIIKKLVEWQGGRVWIESGDGKRGTAIHFLWPAHASAEARAVAGS